MKRISSFLVLFFGIVLSSFGSNSFSGKIILYRENVFQGSGTAYKIYINNSFVIKLKNNSKFEYNCLPGDYRIYADKFQDSVSALHLKVEEGETYYVRFDMHKALLENKVHATLIDSIDAKPITNSQSIKNLEVRKQSTSSHAKNRFGITIPFGFNNHDLVLLNGNDYASLSFGGGFGIGLTLGREFSRYFDLSFDAIYKKSSLDFHVKNNGAYFSRFLISATPAAVIPVSDGNRMRFKIGIGPDIYFANKLKIEALNANEPDVSYTYQSAFGIHLNVIFELNVSKNFTFNYGLRFYGVSYNSEKSEKEDATQQSTLFFSPSGSGLDFIIGLNFHF